MPEQVATPAASVPRDGSKTAANIVKGIQDKANGKSPAAPPTNDQKPPTNPTAEKPVDPNAGKEKYVVEGREVWLTPEQARAYVQKGIAFEPRMDQLARLAQEQVQFQKALLTDPGRVLAGLAKQANVPMKDLVQRVLKGNSSDDIKEAVGQWYYENAVEPLKLSPEQLKAREDSKKLTEYEQREKERTEAAIRQENQARVSKAMAEIKSFIGEAMKESGLPSNDTPLGAEMARMVADCMRVARYQGQGITPKQAIEFVKKRIKSVQTAYYENLDEETLVQELGEKTAEKIQKYFLKKAQQNGGKVPTLTNGKPAARSGERKTLSMDEFHDYLDGLKKTG